MILAVVQARTSSTRLPGKVLESVVGEPMILRQLERVARSRLVDETVVATSIDRSDDALTGILEDAGIVVRRGPLDDVLARFSQVVDEFHPETIVRLTADCPLADPQVIDEVIAAHTSATVDYTSNAIVRTFPRGLDVECVGVGAFGRLTTLPDLSSADREHVTRALYTRPDLFSLGSVVQAPNRSALRWTVDYEEDLAFVRFVYEQLYSSSPAFGQSDILALLARYPELNRTESQVAPL